MAERSETVHVVMRVGRITTFDVGKPMRVADDRVDARNYAARMNKRTTRYRYYVESCKKL